MDVLRSAVFYLKEDGTAGVDIFENASLTVVLKRCEELRKLGYSHVVSSTENSNSVGKPGVAEVGPDYNWKKRRP